MRYHQYRYKFYLNASHAIYIQNRLGQHHPHTWEITLDTIKVVDGFVQFNDVERAIEQFLEQYQDKNINDVEPFNTLNPTLENICEYFKEAIRSLLVDKGWLLLKIEISETPARSYIIDLVAEEDVAVHQMEEEQEGAQKQKNFDELSNELLDSILLDTSVSEKDVQ